MIDDSSSLCVKFNVSSYVTVITHKRMDERSKHFTAARWGLAAHYLNWCGAWEPSPFFKKAKRYSFLFLQAGGGRVSKVLCKFIILVGLHMFFGLRFSAKRVFLHKILRKRLFQKWLNGPSFSFDENI